MMLPDWPVVLLSVLGYVVGSVPFGVIVTKALGGPDPRTVGSRNIGFTNVLRVAGKQAGILTLVGDMGKGWVVAWTARQLVESEAWVLVVAACPILGHLYSVFLGFRGGKGVATAMGSVLGVAPIVGVLLILVWLITAAVWRYSSAAAVAAFVTLPVMTWLLGGSWEFELFAVIVGVLIVLRHWKNLIRLWRGTEPRLGRLELT